MLFVDSIHRSGDWASHISVGEGIAALHQENQQRFDVDGLRLQSVDINVANNVPRWLAIFRSGDWGARLTADRDLTTFGSETQAFFDNEGLRMIHAATYVTDGVRRWAGVYRSADWAHRFTAGRDSVTIAAETKAFFDKEQLRIRTVIPYYEGANLKWAAIYTSGDEPAQLLLDRSRGAFFNDTQDLFNKQGLRVTDVRRYNKGGSELWAGIVTGGNWPNYFFLDRPWQHFLDDSQQLFDEQGLRIVHASLTERPTQVVRLHIKILTQPTTPIAVMVQAMREVYEAYGLTVEIASTETLNLPLLTDLDVGDCTSTVSDDQTLLFKNRNNVLVNEIAVYFCNTVHNLAGGVGYNGCALYPDGLPGVCVSSYASHWTLAHEVGHVLGLQHVDTPAAPLFDRLMTGQGTDYITNPPPDLIPSEVSTMQASAFTIPA